MSEYTPKKPDRMCACGKHKIPYFEADDQWYPLHSIWDEGSDFGDLGSVAVCKACYDKWHDELYDEWKAATGDF
tara:strand:- start:3336 stop:3557 length:222 start_codon:yes stop_codon:yes gene_type:complete